MKPVVAIVAVVAVVAALITAFLAQQWVANQTARPVAAIRPPHQEVLVMARDVPAGTALTGDDLRSADWPMGAATRFAIPAEGNAKDKYVGMIPRRPLFEGEPLIESAIVRPEAGLLAAILESGMRAASVAITNASAVSGFIAPGDHVDVILAADFQRADQDAVGKGGPIVRYAAETVLTDVVVLAIDQQISRGKEAATLQGKTATVAVSPKQAEVLATASMLGQLSLVLRPQETNTTETQPAAAPGTKPYTPDIEASQAMRALTGGAPAGNGGSGIRINRAGVVSTRSF
jgi:pilus assembly protein CpaB